MSLVQSLKALADVNRVKILGMLLNCDLCVGALANQVGLSKPAVSQHLRILREAGLISGEKRGYWTHYSVDRQAVILIAEQLKRLAETRQSAHPICWRINEMPPAATENKEMDMCRNCCTQPDKDQAEAENAAPEQMLGATGPPKRIRVAKKLRPRKQMNKTVL